MWLKPVFRSWGRYLFCYIWRYNGNVTHIILYEQMSTELFMSGMICFRIITKYFSESKTRWIKCSKILTVAESYWKALGALCFFICFKYALQKNYKKNAS